MATNFMLPAFPAAVKSKVGNLNPLLTFRSYIYELNDFDVLLTYGTFHRNHYLHLILFFDIKAVDQILPSIKCRKRKGIKH
jgi:hypothetical protein